MDSEQVSNKLIFPPLKLKEEVKDFLKLFFSSEDLEDILLHLGNPPPFTSVRVNLIKSPSIFKAIENLQQELSKQSEQRESHSSIRDHSWNIFKHEKLDDCIIIPCKGPFEVKQGYPEVYVDAQVFSSVLRGSDVFAPGVIGAASFIKNGDKVSVFVDKEGKMTKGEKYLSSEKKIFIGNGISCMNRNDYFNMKTGVAVQMHETYIQSPSMGHILPDIYFLQNLPSLLIAHLLDPKEGEKILDMCAAPGGKTTHVAIRMNNKGVVYAFDKHEGKVNGIRKLCELLGIVNVIANRGDSANLIKKEEKEEQSISNSKQSASNSNKEEKEEVHKTKKKNKKKKNTLTFDGEYFDRIVLDPPCSGLGIKIFHIHLYAGQRPRAIEDISIEEVRKCSGYQCKLFESAIKLLKPNGVMTYSTCSLNPEENEGVVKYILDKYGDIMELVPQHPFHLGSPGIVWEVSEQMKGVGIGKGLTKEQAQLVQRFTPSSKNDHQIGFFVAKFKKKSK